MDLAELKSAHGHSAQHRSEILQSGECACFYCMAVYPATEVSEWIAEGTCAICPRCGIDAVLGDASGLPVKDEVFLTEMHRHWF